MAYSRVRVNWGARTIQANTVYVMASLLTRRNEEKFYIQKHQQHVIVDMATTFFSDNLVQDILSTVPKNIISPIN